MGSEWPLVTLGDVVDLATGFPFESQRYTGEPGDPRLLRGDNVGQGSLRWDGAKRWPAQSTVGLDDYWLRAGDVILAMDRPWIEAGLKYATVLESDLPALLVQRVARLRGTERLDTRFLRYVIAGRDFTDYVTGIQTGTAVPHISGGQIRGYRFPLPPLGEQRRIAGILGALDDKIELNRRMSQTLESMARALYKSWFVDFDPVLANAEGRDPGLPQQLAELFPESFTDSEIGTIPTGWDVAPFDQLLVLQRGFDLPSPTRKPGPYPVLAASGPSGTHNAFMVRGPGVTTGRSGVLGKVFYVNEDFWPLNTSLWVKEFRHCTPAYAFHFLQGMDLGLFNAGSAVPTLNRNHVNDIPTLLPPLPVLAAFERIATANLRRQKAYDDEAGVFGSLRDTLLPAIISGRRELPTLSGGFE